MLAFISDHQICLNLLQQSTAPVAPPPPHPNPLVTIKNNNLDSLLAKAFFL
jgi:hypothetical protein